MCSRHRTGLSPTKYTDIRNVTSGHGRLVGHCIYTDGKSTEFISIGVAVSKKMSNGRCISCQKCNRHGMVCEVKSNG